MSSIKKPAGHSVYTSNPGTSEYLYMFLIQVPQRRKVVFHEEYSLRVVVFQTSRRIRRHGLQRSGFDARICWILGGIRGPGSGRSRTALCNQNQIDVRAPREAKISPRVREFLPISMTSSTSFQRLKYIFHSSPILGRPVNESRLSDCLSIFSAQIP